MHAELCEHLFSPRSIAIVGASERNPYARSALQRLGDCGYEGRVHLVNPASSSVFGRQAVPRATDTGGVDMAFVVVPRAAVLGVLEDCAAAGAKAAVVISNGFAESSDEEGRRLQRELTAFLQRNPMAVCGPACLGVLNLHGRFQAFGGHPGVPIHPGRVSLVSQSGANVHTFIGAARARNLGYSYIASSGNEAGLELTDYIDFFLDDPHTSVICAYVESIRTPARLIEAAQKALRLRKPIVLIKVGRSESSLRAALAHTGALTGSESFFSALFRQYGILRADSIEEALDRALVFGSSDRRWWPTGGAVGLVSISGGFATALSDLASPATFQVPEFGPATKAALREILPSNVNPQNPIDISTQVQRDRPQAWEATLASVAADAGINFVLDAEALAVGPQRLQALLDLRASSGKPVLLATTSPHIDIFDEQVRERARAEGMPLLAGVDGVRRALEAVLAYAGTPAPTSARPEAAPRESLPPPRERVLHEVEARALLARYGIEGPPGYLATTPAEATRAAASLHAPLVLKIVSPDIPHRSELGLVKVGVAAADVAVVAESLLRTVREHGKDVARCRLLVQAMVQDGVAELIAGVSCRPGYPPVITVGFGGVLVELLKDATTRVCPVDAAGAEAMLRELRLFPTLDGYRGRVPGDIAAAARAIAGLSEFALAAQDWLDEAEINPLLVLPRGRGAQAVDALVVARAQEQDALKETP